MYSSWSSAQRSPSSRVIDWFWPSGSSVTRNVERFERETTSVATLRLPCFVGRAFGMRAASSLRLLRARIVDHRGRLRQPEGHLRHGGMLRRRAARRAAHLRS